LKGDSGSRGFCLFHRGSFLGKGFKKGQPKQRGQSKRNSCRKKGRVVRKTMVVGGGRGGVFGGGDTTRSAGVEKGVETGKKKERKGG